MLFKRWFYRVQLNFQSRLKRNNFSWNILSLCCHINGIFFSNIHFKDVSLGKISWTDCSLVSPELKYDSFNTVVFNANISLRYITSNLKNEFNT